MREVVRTREEERWKPRGCSSADSRCAEAVLGVVYRDEGKRSRDPRGIRAGSSLCIHSANFLGSSQISLKRDLQFNWRKIDVLVQRERSLRTRSFCAFDDETSFLKNSKIGDLKKK